MAGGCGTSRTKIGKERGATSGGAFRCDTVPLFLVREPGFGDFPHAGLA